MYAARFHVVNPFPHLSINYLEVKIMRERGIAKVFTAPRAQDGDGVDLRRAFPGSTIMDLDPFLLLDQMGPRQFAAGQARGFPPHPHRGFETVTYLLSGEMQHRDSWGNHGVLRPGDVQWMTAGSGLVHSEMPGATLLRDGGTLHGFQLWINLPRKDKMLAPRYQDTASDRIPVARADGGRVQVRVIAGESLGTPGVIDTRIPILYLHVTLDPGAEFTQSIPRSENAFAFVIDGEGAFAGAKAAPNQVAVFDRAGETVRVANTGAGPLSFLLIAGEPIGEPVARYGPFVMNSREEIVQAADDFRAGRMGVLAE
jgi:redox-sensitive bicupin YhaK (pirin superfamily)